MNATTLGMTNLSVSAIAIATRELEEKWGVFTEQDAINAMRRARQLGLDVFDIARGYGFGASEHQARHRRRPCSRNRTASPTVVRA